MTYIWNRVERVPTEHASNITKSFDEWLAEQNNKLNKERDLVKKKNMKAKINKQTISYQDAMKSLSNK